MACARVATASCKAASIMPTISTVSTMSFHYFMPFNSTAGIMVGAIAVNIIITASARVAISILTASMTAKTCSSPCGDMAAHVHVDLWTIIYKTIIITVLGSCMHA